MPSLVSLPALFAILALASPTARAQSCAPGDEFCVRHMPCYRSPDDPECDDTCHCGSPTYPDCDPLCPPGVGCDPACATDPCVDEFGRYLCDGGDQPNPCPPGEAVSAISFTDDLDGDADGQIVALLPSQTRSCATIHVEETGYYEIFDMELSESCTTQVDETGYLTVENTCNAGGEPLEHNAAGHFVVDDQDNIGACTAGSGSCGAGLTCRDSGPRYGFCCGPDSPVFLGTFLLVAGEANKVCVNHWCPEYHSELSAGRDWGHVNDGCSNSNVNSIHLRLDSHTLVCRAPDTVVRACAWGCAMGGCLPDPCDAADCPAFCRDGVCLDTNPCDSLGCEYGCHHGRCLQPPWTTGPDADGDGYSSLAECDDTDASVHPGAVERCGTGIDEDCDGLIDEAGCEGGADAGAGRDAGGSGRDGGGSGADGGGGTGSTGSLKGGCGCRIGATREAHGATALLLTLALGLAWRRRR